MRRWISFCMAAILSFSILLVPAKATESAADAFGTAAPAVSGVKWWLAPTYQGNVETSGKNGFVRYQANGKFGILNQFGKQVLSCQFAYAEANDYYLSASLTRSTLDHNTAVYALDGTKLTEHIYQQDVRESEYSDASGQFALLYTAGHMEMAYLNLNTGAVLPAMKNVGDFAEGYAGFTAADGRVGYMDTKGMVHYAPSDFTYVGGLGSSTLEYVRKSGEKQYAGICALDFTPMVEIDKKQEDFNVKYDFGVAYVKSKSDYTKTKVYDTAGRLILNIQDGYVSDPYINEAGHICIPFLSEQSPFPSDLSVQGTFYSGKSLVYDTAAKTISWDTHSNLPEGYSLEGKEEIGYLNVTGSVGLKDANGKFVIPQRYARLTPVCCGGQYLMIAQDNQGNYYLFDISGKKLAGPYFKIEIPTMLEDPNDWNTEIPATSNFLLATSQVGQYQEEKLSVLDKDGKVLASNADNVAFAEDGFVTRIYTDETYTDFTAAYYDKNGSRTQASATYFPSEGCAHEGVQRVELVVNGVTKYGLCDDKMELITPVVFDGMTISSAGQIWVKYQGKWGIIDNPLNDTAEKTWGAYLGKAFTNSSNGTTGPVQSTGSMKDIAGSWCEEYVMDLVDRGIASGYADGTYRPGTPVTRGAIAKMTMLAMQDAGSMIQESTEDDPFPDMAGNWAEVYAVPLAQAGILGSGRVPGWVWRRYGDDPA